MKKMIAITDLENLPPCKGNGTLQEKAIGKFFDKVGDIYDNPNDVEVIWLGDYEVYACAPWPGIDTGKNISLEVGVEAESYAAFAEVFGIKNKVQKIIDEITPEQLVSLYEEGTAEVFCQVENNAAGSLEFKKENNKLFARDDADNVHEVKQPLEKPEHFIDYTRRYMESQQN